MSTESLEGLVEKNDGRNGLACFNTLRTGDADLRF